MRLSSYLDSRAIYALPSVSYGVLLYTGTTDAEGTLGGLIEVGKWIHEHVRKALEMGELCSNDPVCPSISPKTAMSTGSFMGPPATDVC